MLLWQIDSVVQYLSSHISQQVMLSGYFQVIQEIFLTKSRNTTMFELNSVNLQQHWLFKYIKY